MSILTELLHGKITFTQAATQAEAWASKVSGGNPVLTAIEGAVLSNVKQAASNAVDLAEGELGKLLAGASGQVEAALDGLLASATGGLSTPFNPLINHGIDTIANAIKAEADAWALRVKASLASPVTTAPPK